MVPPEKDTDPYGQLDRKADTAFLAAEESGLAWLRTRLGPDSTVDAPEEPRHPCWPWRGTLSFQPQGKMRTSAPAATAEESRGAPSDSCGDWISPKPNEQIPDVPVVTQQEPCLNSIKPRISPQSELRPFSTAASRDKSHLTS